jgi:hypothetical protein
MKRSLASLVFGGLVTMALLGASSPLDAAGRERMHGMRARIVPAGEAERPRIRAIETTPQAELPLGEPFRAHFGRADLYIPARFAARGGAYDLVVHFHGLKRIQENNVETSGLNAVVVSINVGMGSGPYEEAFRNPAAFAGLLRNVERLVASSGRVSPSSRVGRIALSAWSAGYGSVSAILRHKPHADRVDAVLLADGPHGSFKDKARHVVAEGSVALYKRIAEQAVRGDKLFALTHSSITTDGYPSTTETIGALLREVGVAKSPLEADGPRGMKAIYESHEGDFHVAGYRGVTAKDHMNHVHGMGETLYPLLRDRWAR